MLVRCPPFGSTQDRDVCSTGLEKAPQFFLGTSSQLWRNDGLREVLFRVGISIGLYQR